MYSSVSNGIVRQCTLVLKETLTYYVNNHSTVFCSFLDTSKAFDRVHYCKLLRLLIDRGMPPYTVRITMKSLCWTCNRGYVERYVFYFFAGLLFFLYLCFACRAKWVHSHQQDVEPEDRSGILSLDNLQQYASSFVVVHYSFIIRSALLD